MENYKNKKVTVMGLGLLGSGVSVAKFFSRQGARVTVTDIKPQERLKASLERLKKFKNIQYILGQHRPEDFSRADLVIKGPSVPSNSKYLEIARKKGVPIDTEAGLFFKLVKNPVIGVTGTRGKSTTVALINKILRQAGKKTVMGGNISHRPLLDLLGEAKKDSWMVVELSSFQLEGMEVHGQSPQIAVVTNLGRDHLNRYSSLEKYHEAKETIVKYQTDKDTAILNHDDEEVRGWVAKTKGRVWYFSRHKLGGERVIFVDEGKIKMHRNGETKEIMELDRIKLIGKHRVYNILAAVAVAKTCGVEVKKIRLAVEKFGGIPHRLEVIREHKGMIFVNDTTATTPEAAMKALDSFNGSVVLIAGGADKGLDFNELAQKIIGRVRELILVPGKGTDRLIKALRRNIPEELGDYDFQTADSMEEAVALAAQTARAGEVVLLSPGCSSFGMFENEFERGDKFREGVEAL